MNKFARITLLIVILPVLLIEKVVLLTTLSVLLVCDRFVTDHKKQVRDLMRDIKFAETTLSNTFYYYVMIMITKCILSLPIWFKLINMLIVWLSNTP